MEIRGYVSSHLARVPWHRWPCVLWSGCLCMKYTCSFSPPLSADGQGVISKPQSCRKSRNCGEHRRDQPAAHHKWREGGLCEGGLQDAGKSHVPWEGSLFPRRCYLQRPLVIILKTWCGKKDTGFKNPVYWASEPWVKIPGIQPRTCRLTPEPDRVSVGQ